MSVEPPKTRSSLLGAQVEIPDHVVHRPFPTETVILNLQTGMYHGLNPVASRMLEELERQQTVGEAVAVVAEEYDQAREDVERDVCRLCEDLAQRGLISLRASEGHLAR